MTPTYRIKPPSLGFCLIVLTWAATAFLLVWGFSTPPLHRAWEFVTRLNQEDASLPTSAEIHAVTHVLQRHPEWASVLTDGRPAAVLESPWHHCLRFSTTHLVVLPSHHALTLQLHCKNAPQLRIIIEKVGEFVCDRTITNITVPASTHPRLLRVQRLTGPRVYPDDASCPSTIEVDSHAQSFNHDTPLEDNDATQD